MKVQSINPRTEKVVKEFKSTNLEDINEIILKSRKAQKSWFLLSKEERIKKIKELKNKLLKSKSELLEVIYQETGYSEKEIEPIFLDIISGIDYFCNKYSRLEDIDFDINQDTQPNTDAKIKFIPHGVIAHIGVWNYPFWQTMISLIPALLTGNSVVFKPSTYTTWTAVKIKEILDKILPENLFSLIIGDKVLGKELVKSNVDGIVFTGNIETSKDIIKNAGIKPIILESSGNDAAIICEDCNINETVRGICYGTFLHSGQVCIRIKRVYVLKNIADKFIQNLVKYSKRLKLGKEITPLIRKVARENINRRIQDSLKNGNELLLGGKIPDKKGYYYPATIIKINNDDDELIKKEIFGPVCLIKVVDSIEEAVKLSNSSEYGLGASIWSKNINKSRKIVEELEVGNVWINDSNIPLVSGEYSQGVKNSSISNSQERLMMFLKKKTVITHNLNKSREWWF